MKKYITLLGALISVVFSHCQSDLLNGDNQIFNESVRTVIFHHSGNELSQPYVELGNGQLFMRFDDIGGDFRDLYYTVYLCDAQWNFSEHDQVEYVTGFAENYISDYEQSFNTYVDFTHYQLSFPNDMSSVNRSGNYLLVVYEDGDIDQPVLARRFVVFENLVGIDARMKQPTEIGERKYRQEVDFTIHHDFFDIQNPYEDLTVQILQNNRWDNAIGDLKPRFVKDRELDYDYGKENTFDGGNEFREFDLKQLDFITLQVARIELVDKIWNCWLKPDPKRTFLQYKTIRDINGNFLVRNDDGFETHLESDYVVVHFTLPFDFPMAESEIYVYGALSNWQKHPDFKMDYNYDRKQYECSVMLKQGFYNYLYLIDGADYFGQNTNVEGSHFVTENEYMIFVYNYDIAEDYDRVIGMKLIENQ